MNTHPVYFTNFCVFHPKHVLSHCTCHVNTYVPLVKMIELIRWFSWRNYIFLLYWLRYLQNSVGTAIRFLSKSLQQHHLKVIVFIYFQRVHEVLMLHWMVFQ